MNPRFPFIALIATIMPLHSQEAGKEVVPKQELVEYKEYLGLLGEEYCGNVFVIDSKGTTGRLTGIGLVNGEFKSAEKPRELSFILDQAADVRGGSGHEVIHVKSGKPIGVLIAANNEGKDATRIVFEPICLPIAKPEAKK